MAKLKDLILKRDNSIWFRRLCHEIVKYHPEFYDDNGRYLKEEWTSFDDVGHEYEGKVVTIDDYLEIENRFIEITHAILEESGCEFVTLGYVEQYRSKAVKEGKRIRVSHLDYYLRMALRGEAFIVFINVSRGIQFDWSPDCLYMHLYCRIPLNRLRSIVESRGLFLDPRSK